MAWWFWIVLGAVLLAAEVIIAADFYLVFFGIAALVVGLLAVFGVELPVWSQWLLFAGLAIAGLVVYRGRWKKNCMPTAITALPRCTRRARAWALRMRAAAGVTGSTNCS